MKKTANDASNLIAMLWPEVFQAEQSARSHSGREAKRFGHTPPASAMRAVADHAAASLVALRPLAARHGYEASTVGRILGQAISVVRTASTDLLVSSEKSYRATVLGVHHGIGVFALLEDAATACGDQPLADLCRAWLAERRALCATAEDALAWFAENPGRAMRRASAPRSGWSAATAEVSSSAA
jgi:hypothetical protein